MKMWKKQNKTNVHVVKKHATVAPVFIVVTLNRGNPP